LLQTTFEKGVPFFRADAESQFVNGNKPISFHFFILKFLPLNVSTKLFSIFRPVKLIFVSKVITTGGMNSDDKIFDRQDRFVYFQTLIDFWASTPSIDIRVGGERELKPIGNEKIAECFFNILLDSLTILS
jgi:hypothetical protein